MQEYGVELVAWDALPKADAVVLAVAHQAVLAMPTKDICSKLKPGGCFVDVKSQMDVSQFTAAGFNVWKL
jgi:UDP-N-acetyl-D-galactosamine dehydrogenase